MIEIVVLCLVLCGFLFLLYQEKGVQKGKIPFRIKEK